MALEAAYQDLPFEMMCGGGKGVIWRQQPVFLLIFIFSLLSSVFELDLLKFKGILQFCFCIKFDTQSFNFYLFSCESLFELIFFHFII
jgi:hypothetical protein